MRLLLILLFVPISLAGYELSICAIFRDEAPYLKEWIEFHKLQGVEHFYLYNNNSTDEYEEILAPYIEQHLVTLLNWPYAYRAAEVGDYEEWRNVQARAYDHCLDNFGDQTKWIAFIDIDEFLFCPSGQALPSFLIPYSCYGGLVVNWLCFGTSYLEDIPAGQLLIEALTRCSSRTLDRNRNYKSIVQPKYVLGCYGAHVFYFKKGYYSVQDTGQIIKNRINTPYLSIDRIRINHYWTRTERYAREKKAPSRAARRTYQDGDYVTETAKTYNDCVDTAIQIYVPALRKAMGL